MEMGMEALATNNSKTFLILIVLHHPSYKELIESDM
jgi:hypothetical protein